MKKLVLVAGVLSLGLLASCGGDAEPSRADQMKERMEANAAAEAAKVKASERVDLENKGIGPITSITLEPVDEALAAEGKAVFDRDCTACHKADKKFVGPSPQGIMERRSPEWIMNMILDPEGMVAEDALAKDLLMEFNGSPMANQNLTEEEARAVLEYFRTL